MSAGRNLVLIGMMGSGKSVVGERLARRLGRPCVDTDALVESEAGLTVAQLFDREGERRFRVREAAAVAAVAAMGGQVIAVGGGAVLNEASLTALQATGELVLLDAAPSVLARRLATCQNRPLLRRSGQHHDDLLAALVDIRSRRDQVYRRAAAHTVDTSGRTPDEVADAVLAWARTQPGLGVREQR